MKRAILIDGNNLLFRSYYATAYTGSLMKNSKDFPTNALFGFVNMINKIINEEQPEYIMVAFDKGKNFRHEKYDNYKAGRIETPSDLKVQFPKAYEILDAMGIKAIDFENYEADDIIGTFAKMADEDKMYDATIISSDKDLLQLISSDVNVKLLKQKDYILMDEKIFFETYGLTPIKMIDIKALMGDASDNIPGVKGIGEKTALKLLQEYGTIEKLYENIDMLKGATKDKLLEGKKDAFFSKEIATIYKDVPLNMTFEDIKIKEKNNEKLIEIYNDLEFFSFIKRLDVKEVTKELNIVKVKDKINIDKKFAYYLELNDENYHTAQYVGMSIYDGEKSYYLDKDALLLNKHLFENDASTYDFKKNIVFLDKLGIKLNSTYDTMIAGYLLNYNTKDDIAYLANIKNYNIAFYENMFKNGNILLNDDELIKNIALKSKFIYETKESYLKELNNEGMLDLFNNIEMPLIKVLAKMEMNGIAASVDQINVMSKELDDKINILCEEIYKEAGETFNIQSPKQISEILYDKLLLPHGKKKGANGYPTDHDTLLKLVNHHPIIELILEHRNLSKIKNTYLDKLTNYIHEDGKIHTIFKQAITRTGRLSSVLPNLQNIPIRTTEGKKIRKAFLPEADSVILTSDYSQIELRLLAHISNCENLINAFVGHEDIHTKVASDIYGIPVSDVTKNERRTAKAVIFGIVYGISGFGLGENLQLNAKEAQKLIDKYLCMYPGVKKYMDEIVENAKEIGYVTTIFGRKRIIDELLNTNYIIRKSGERIALNTPIQGSSADIIKKAMIEIDSEIENRNLKSKMLLQVHDELVFTVPKDEINLMKELVIKVMENTYNLSVPLKVEVEMGENWYDAK